MAPNAVQETLEAGALDYSLTHCLMEVLPFKVEELPPENNDYADHQQTTAQEHDDLQAALFDDTDSTFWLGGK